MNTAYHLSQTDPKYHRNTKKENSKFLGSRKVASEWALNSSNSVDEWMGKWEFSQHIYLSEITYSGNFL